MKNLKLKVIEADLLIDETTFKNCGILENGCEIIRLFFITLISFLSLLYTIITYPYNVIINIIEYIIDKITVKKLRKQVEQDLLNHASIINKNIGLLYLKDTYENIVLDNIKDVNDYLYKHGYSRYHQNQVLKLELSILTMFIYNYINYLNICFDTIHANNNTTQCRCDRRRSIGDIYLVCKYYFPNITIIDVVKSLSTLIERDIVHSSRCGFIEKYVFTKGRAQISGKLEFTDIVRSDKLFKLFKEN